MEYTVLYGRQGDGLYTINGISADIVLYDKVTLDPSYCAATSNPIPFKVEQKYSI